jgi:hypothetical protein
MVLAAPGAASAQGWGGSQGRGLLTPYGEYFLLGGGLSDHTESEVKDRLDLGAAWNVRLGFGSRYYVGGEVAYVGSSQQGAGTGSDLLANGAEGIVRVQYPYATGRWLLEPFAFGGIGWSHLSLQDAAPSLKDSDEIGVVPFGGGFTVGYGRALLDARFTYRATFDEDLALAVNDGPANQEQWSVELSIGYEL